MFETPIAYLTQDFRRPVRGMVIDDDNVQMEIRPLAERALDGIADRSFTIPDGYDDAGLNRKFFISSRNLLEARFEPCADTFEMRSGNLLHLDLVITITGIDILKLLLFNRTRFGIPRVVQRLGNSDDGMLLRNPQAQIIQAAPPPIVGNSYFPRCSKGDSHDWSKIESVANTAPLIIDSRTIHCVGINPAGASLAYDFGHSVEHTRARLDARVGVCDEDNVRIRLVYELPDTCRGIIFWVDGLHCSPRQVLPQ